MPRAHASARRSVALEVEELEDRLVLSTADYVTALYQDLLHRNPAPDEVTHFAYVLNTGTSATAVAQLFTRSAEFQTNEVQADYQMFLGRQPSPTEAAGWVGELQGGASENQVQAAFLASDEFFAQHGGAPAPWLDGIYQAVLDRPVDAGGQASWTLALQNGVSRQQVAVNILTSTEAEYRLTTAAYLDLLQRAPSPTDLTNWAAALQSGLTPSGLLAALASSQEYIQLRAPDGLDTPTPLSPPDTGVAPPDFTPPDFTPPVIVPDPGITDNSGNYNPGIDPGPPVDPGIDPGTAPGIDPGVTSGSDPSVDGTDCGC